jgi:hypothetical protein
LPQFLEFNMTKYTHRTRSGLPARIVCTDMRNEFPVLALILGEDGVEHTATLSESLSFTADIEAHQLDLFEAKPWEFERPAPEVVEVGKSLMSRLMDASARKSLGGLGGCQVFDLNDFPTEFHDLIQAYINEEVDAVEAAFIAMRRAEAQHA